MNIKQGPHSRLINNESEANTENDIKWTVHKLQISVKNSHFYNKQI